MPPDNETSLSRKLQMHLAATRLRNTHLRINLIQLAGSSIALLMSTAHNPGFDNRSDAKCHILTKARAEMLSDGSSAYRPTAEFSARFTRSRRWWRLGSLLHEPVWRLPRSEMLSLATLLQSPTNREPTWFGMCFKQMERHTGWEDKTVFFMVMKFDQSLVQKQTLNPNVQRILQAIVLQCNEELLQYLREKSNFTELQFSRHMKIFGALYSRVRFDEDIMELQKAFKSVEYILIRSRTILTVKCSSLKNKCRCLWIIQSTFISNRVYENNQIFVVSFEKNISFVFYHNCLHT